jgi:hypothetical protein
MFAPALISRGIFFDYFLAQGGAALPALIGAAAGAANAAADGAALPDKDLKPLTSLLAPY